MGVRKCNMTRFVFPWLGQRILGHGHHMSVGALVAVPQQCRALVAVPPRRVLVAVPSPPGFGGSAPGCWWQCPRVLVAVPQGVGPWGW